jgi:trans-aconitate methyltransferase
LLIISLARGFRALSVLDLSATALDAAKSRLGAQAESVEWIVADATLWEPTEAYGIWYDRAAFHFLIEERDRAAYIVRMKKSLRPGGHAIVATFGRAPHRAEAGDSTRRQMRVVAIPRHLARPSPARAGQAFSRNVHYRATRPYRTAVDSPPATAVGPGGKARFGPDDARHE